MSLPFHPLKPVAARPENTRPEKHTLETIRTTVGGDQLLKPALKCYQAVRAVYLKSPERGSEHIYLWETAVQTHVLLNPTLLHNPPERSVNTSQHHTQHDSSIYLEVPALRCQLCGVFVPRAALRPAVLDNVQMAPARRRRDHLLVEERAPVRPRPLQDLGNRGEKRVAQHTYIGGQL